MPRQSRLLIPSLLLALCGPVVSKAVLWGDETPRSPALRGLDPVALAQGVETPGDPGISLQHRDFRYLFATRKNRREFLLAPQRFGIQNHSCPIAPSAAAASEHFAVFRGRIYIFATRNCIRTFKGNPEFFVYGPTDDEDGKNAQQNNHHSPGETDSPGGKETNP